MTTCETVLQIRPWHDEVIDACGFEPASGYVELCWLPILGPSTIWRCRRLVAGLTAKPEGYAVGITELAESLGLGTGTGRNAPINRTIERLVRFGLARHEGPDVLAVRRRLPPLVLPQVQRLSPRLQQAHAHLLARHQRHPAAS
jgi:hypothetical protein